MNDLSFIEWISFDELQEKAFQLEELVETRVRANTKTLLVKEFKKALFKLPKKEQERFLSEMRPPPLPPDERTFGATDEAPRVALIKHEEKPHVFYNDIVVNPTDYVIKTMQLRYISLDYARLRVRGGCRYVLGPKYTQCTPDEIKNLLT